MAKRVAIVQSNYIPWKGYFDLIRAVDEFILYDDVQYTRSDWRNRNKIKTPQGSQWLTIPVEVKGKYYQSIQHTRISDPGWARQHWRTICHNYARAPYFAAYREQFEHLYLGCEENLLSCVNHRFLGAICAMLGIGTQISWSMDYPVASAKTERLVDLSRLVGATEYLSEPAAKHYIVPELFEPAGITLCFATYCDYPEYPQMFGSFERGVSIVDLLFNTGPKAAQYLKRLYECT